MGLACDFVLAVVPCILRFCGVEGWSWRLLGFGASHVGGGSGSWHPVVGGAGG